ncbi:MAG: GNAT family N-acetyltransferase, partial [Caldilineaceae bacterium]|nr:GNAT family N-acetyltransferase [Caldilineaceae bacterium]
MSNWHIRPFAYAAADYAAQALLQTALNPQSAQTVEKLKFWDDWWDPSYRRARFLVESAGQPVAIGHYEEWIWWYEPGRYYVSLEVHPDFRNQGIGSALYDHLMRELATETPQGTIFMTKCREDQPATIRFLTQRGFAETGRELYSELDLTTFHPQRFAAVDERMAQQGITIVAYPELAATDPLCHRKCYALQGESMTGMPAGGERTRQSFEQYVQQIFENAAFIPATFFVALDQGRYVGLSNLTNENDDPIRLTTDYTGVLP